MSKDARSLLIETRKTNNYGRLADAVAQADPSRIAIIEEPGKRQRTYEELVKNLDRVMAWSISEGFAPGDRVGVLLGNCIEFIECVFGLSRAGLVPVLVNPKQGLEALIHALTDSRAAGVIVKPEASPHGVAASDAAGIQNKYSIGVKPAGWSVFALPENVGALPDFIPSSETPALQPYTSGSTGRPKGVVLTHGGQVWSSVMHADYMLTLFDAETPSALVAVPVFHANALYGGFQPQFAYGGKTVLCETFDPGLALTALAEHQLTFTMGVPTMYEMMLAQNDYVSTLDFSAMEAVFCGSAPGREAMLERFEKAMGIRVCHVYGLTEGGPGVMAHPADSPRGPLASCGKPESPEIEVKLVRDGQTVSDSGELWVRNPGLASHYYNLPELTQERFRDGWLRTGDIMSVDSEGWFYFQGRVDEMFVCSGENLYPLEVERVLLNFPEIEAASVAPLPHSTKSNVPGAAVTFVAGAQLTQAEIVERYISVAPAFSHPRLIVVADELPLGPTGKIDRKEVEKILLQQWDLAQSKPIPLAEAT